MNRFIVTEKVVRVHYVRRELVFRQRQSSACLRSSLRAPSI